MGLSLMNVLGLSSSVHCTYSMLLKGLPFALHTSYLSIQALQGRSCLSYVYVLFSSQGHIATAGQSVSKSWRLAPSETHDQIFSYYYLIVTVLFLWGGSVFCICCWVFPMQSFSDPSPLGLATMFYSLIFETFNFVASYDSQGHGGGIRPRLHTSQLHGSLYRPAHIHGKYWFLARIPRNLYWIFVDTRTCFGEMLASNERFTSVRCYSGFQAVFTEPLPRNGHIRHNMLLDKSMRPNIKCTKLEWTQLSFALLNDQAPR
jgi:hypothetical protein